MGFARHSQAVELVIGGGQKAVTFPRREVQILRLLADGSSTQQASRSLGISRRTAEHYLENARARAEGMTTKELIAQLVAAGLIIPKQGPARASSAEGEHPRHDKVP